MTLLPPSFKNDLKNNICFVRFEKVDGTIREMTCTLREDIVPPFVRGEQTSGKPSKEFVVAVWDTVAEAWRSFRTDSVLEFKIVDGGFAP
jgi:hypothetical protein